MGAVANIAICLALHQYQNKPAPGLNSFMGVGITLNTITAILSTVGRASLLLPVAECISQQKWAWFSGSVRPLTELEAFDQGSRGAFGSLMLLWRINVQYSHMPLPLNDISNVVVGNLSRSKLFFSSLASPSTRCLNS
jgi:hypothetical protein